MKWYCCEGERWTPRNWGLLEWVNIASIVISLIALAMLPGGVK